MRDHVCCSWKATAGQKQRLWRGASGGVISGALLLLIPKCPMCVAGYIAIVTGLGVSITTAVYLRDGMLALCALALAYIAVKHGLLAVIRKAANRAESAHR